jgi:hypothetical protein
MRRRRVSEAIYAAVPGTATERLVCGRPENRDLVALVWKRAFAIAPSGECTATDEPVALDEDSLPWDAAIAAPFCSPPRTETDLFAFKPATDVVVQGHVYAHGEGAAVEAALEIGDVAHVVRAFGDRRAEWENGRVRFSAPELFERIPLRFDRAYGGLDAVALARRGDDVGEGLAAAQPLYADALATATPFHYPRNPSGCGFLIDADAESVAATRVPNFELASDPITPERLAVGAPGRWPGAPLPAGLDWIHPSWFPRIAYLGFAPEHDASPAPLPEAVRGWAPADLLTGASPQRVHFDARFQQGAAPGLGIESLPPGAELRLRHLAPGQRELRVRLPASLPTVHLSLGASDAQRADTRVTAVLVEPDRGRVTLTYSARREAPRRYGNHELAAMSWRIDPS